LGPKELGGDGLERGGIMRRLARGSTAVVTIVLPTAAVGAACTVFSYAADGIILFGNNEDYARLEPHIWFVPGRGPYYGVLCLGFGEGAPQGGMDTAGLCYDAAGSTAITLNWHREKATALPGWLTLVLQQCATVDEVEPFVRRYDFSSSGMAQFLWLDRTGDSLIVTSGPDGEIVFLRQSGGRRVITSFNVTDPSYGRYPCWRYDTAEMLLLSIESGSREASIATFRAILQGVHQSQSTTYSNIFDLVTLTAYVYRDHNYRDVRILDLREVFATGPPPETTLDATFDATAPD
jgi:hypothetical protein